MLETASRFVQTARELGPQLSRGVEDRDRDDAFVADNFKLLKEHRFLSAHIPEELGGGGASLDEMCEVLRELAHHCSSTALSFSMHAHLVAAQVWNYKHDRPAPVLERIVANDLVLIATGGNDWLESNGTATREDGGYRVSARKPFASASPLGDILVTSACYEDPDDGPSVLHFPVPFSAEGLSLSEDWRVMGMRSTGSNTVILDNVFVPDEAVALKRPRAGYPPILHVVAAVALPLVMGVYVGIAERAAEIARERAAKREYETATAILLGEMENALTTAQLAWREMVALGNNWDFAPAVARTNRVFQCKTICARASLDCAEKALEAVGGHGFFRELGIERLVRDVHAGQFHPLQEKRQLLFSGRLALGLEPTGG